MIKKIKGLFYKPILNRKQKQVNELLEKDGFTDEVLAMQLEINKKRNELNLSEVKGFAQ